MDLEFESKVMSTNRFEAEFQNENEKEIRLKHYSGRENNRIMGVGRSEEVVPANGHFVKMNSQHGRETSIEDMGSLFGRLKCKNTSTSRDNSRDNHDSIGKSVKPNNSKGVHTISTPWLVVEKDRNRATRHDNRHNKNDHMKHGNSKNHSIKVVSSVQDSHLTTDDANADAATKKPKTKSLRSVISRRRRNTCTTQNIVSALEPIVSSTIYDESSSHYRYSVFPGSTSGDFTSIEMERVVNENRDDFYSYDNQIMESMEPSANPKANIRQCGENENHNKSTEFENHDNELSTFIGSNDICYSDDTNSILNTHEDQTLRMVSSAIPGKYCMKSNINSTSIGSNIMPTTVPHTKRIVCMNDSYKERQHQKYSTIHDENNRMECRETKITTPRRRNRSPSPSRLRGKPEYKESIAPQKGKYESHRHVTTDCDRELLMGLEMHKDLDRVSLKCGASESEGLGPSSYSEKERNPPREDIRGFSIFPSSISCLNPTLELDEFEKTENIFYSANADDENNRMLIDKSTSNSFRLKPMTNNFCSGASSALLLDVKEDDRLWKFYDDTEYKQRLSNMEETSAEIKDRESRENQNLPVQNGRESYAIDRNHRLSCDETGLDKFDHPASDGVTRNHASKDVLIYENTRDQTRYEEYHDPFVNSRTPMAFESEHHLDKNLVIDEHLANHEYAFSTFTNDLRDNKVRDKPLGKEYTTMGDNDKESHYESLMNYPNYSRYDGQEEIQHKEALLDQMRYAVKKASAQFDSRKIVKAIDSSSEERYRSMTMETEYSDGSSYVSDCPQQRRNRLLQLDLEKRKSDKFANNRTVISSGSKRDKYDFT